MHFHIFCAPPIGAQFAYWLLKAWTDVVKAEDPGERKAHLHAGRRVDWAEGLRDSDPRRVTVYFTKHGSADFGNKKYLNRPPAEWVGEGNALGRFWGYWREAVEVAVPLDKHRVVFAGDVAPLDASDAMRPQRIGLADAGRGRCIAATPDAGCAGTLPSSARTLGRNSPSSSPALSR